LFNFFPSERQTTIYFKILGNTLKSQVLILCQSTKYPCHPPPARRTYFGHHSSAHHHHGLHHGGLHKHGCSQRFRGESRRNHRLGLRDWPRDGAPGRSCWRQSRASPPPAAGSLAPASWLAALAQSNLTPATHSAANTSR
jgi:hypothetical protein